MGTTYGVQPPGDASTGNQKMTMAGFRLKPEEARGGIYPGETRSALFRPFDGEGAVTVGYDPAT